MVNIKILFYQKIYKVVEIWIWYFYLFILVDEFLTIRLFNKKILKKNERQNIKFHVIETNYITNQQRYCSLLMGWKRFYFLCRDKNYISTKFTN